MAAPLVSATVALVKHDHPTYSHSQVQDALFNTAKDLGAAGKDTTYGHGSGSLGGSRPHVRL